MMVKAVHHTISEVILPKFSMPTLYATEIIPNDVKYSSAASTKITSPQEICLTTENSLAQI